MHVKLMLSPCYVTEQQMNRRIFTIFKTTKLKIIKSRQMSVFGKKLKFLR